MKINFVNTKTNKKEKNNWKKTTKKKKKKKIKKFEYYFYDKVSYNDDTSDHNGDECGYNYHSTNE